MTINNAKTVRQVLNDGGDLEGDSYPYVYSYTSVLNGDVHYALFQHQSQIDIFTSPFVQDAICLLDGGLVTPEGADWLQETLTST